MDYSSVVEPQQQQFQQLQSDRHQPGDPSQAQEYEAYSAYEEHYDAYAYQHQPYYSHDYLSSSTVAAFGGYYAATQPDAASLRVDGAHVHHSGLEGVGHATIPEQRRLSYQVPRGMNPAATAALTQLSHLAGSIDAAERTMVGMNERSWDGIGEGMVPTLAQQHYTYPIMIHLGAPIRPGVRGVLPCIRGSRRGGMAYRGRDLSRGHMGQLPYARDVGPLPSRGRGRGHMNRGRGRGFHHSAPEAERHQTTVATTSVPPISAAAAEVRGPLPAPKPQQRPLLVAWCDLCRVDCNTKEILEQHKNGKRHKRTLQRVQELQAQQMDIVGLQLSSVPTHSMHLPEVHTDTAAPHGVANKALDSTSISPADGVEAGDLVKKDAIPPEHEPTMDEPSKGSLAPEQTSTLPSATNQDLGTVGDASQDETMQKQSVAKKRRMHGSNDRWRGAKRKMVRLGRGGKHFNGFDRPKTQPFGHSKERPRDRPRVCTICSVTCDTLAVFECHLSGKKHLSRIKRFEGQGSVYGPISVYIPPNQPTPCPIKGPEPVFYGMQTHAALQHNEEFHGHESDSVPMVNHIVAVEDTEKVPGREVNLEVNQGSEFSEQANPAACEETPHCDPEAGETANAEAAAAVTAEDVALPVCGDSTAGIVHGSDGAVGEPLADTEMACMEAGSQLNQSI